MKNPLTLVLVASLTMVACGQAAVVSKYPERTITLVVPHPPGASTDLVGRSLADRLKGVLGQSVVVENKASPQVGVPEVIQATADGYTVGYVHSNYLTLTPLLSDLPFKGPDDMSVIATAHSGYLMLAVSPTSPFTSLKEFIAAAKQSPGKIRVSASALGSLDHVNFLQFSDLAQISLTYVPFGGGAPSLANFLGGHSEALIVTPNAIKPHVDAGKARVLGVFAANRIALMPDVATMKEQGFDVAYTFYGVMFGPKNLPDDVKTKLQNAVKSVAESAEYANGLKVSGFENIYYSSAELRKGLADEYAKMKTIVEKFKLRTQ